MDDFEYSVDIADGDWDCFFAECEACNLHSPPLARVDDSGMSDLDDTRLMLAKNAQTADQTRGFSEAVGPSDYQGSPLENHLSKRAVGALESVLSGSEEDIHLESVNMFFESLRNVKKPERLAEPRQVVAGQNREAAVEQQHCSDGQQSTSCSLPKHTAKLNSVPARDEAMLGKETIRTISSINTVKNVQHGLSDSPDNPVLKDKKSAQPELSFRKDASTQAEWTWLNDQIYRNISSETSHNINSPPSIETWTHVKSREEQMSLFPTDIMSIHKSASPELSPSASIKRKRRKKRRLSSEPPESPRGHDRRVLVWPSDSEEELYTGRRRTNLCLPDKVNLFYFNDPPNTCVPPSYSISNSLPLRTSAGTTAHDLSHTYVPRSQERSRATSLAENNTAFNALYQGGDNVMSAAKYSDVVTSFQPCIKLQVEELPGQSKYSWLPVLNDKVTGESDKAGKPADGGRKVSDQELQEPNNLNQTIKGCERLICCTAEVKSITDIFLPCAPANDSPLETSHNDTESDAKSVLALEAGNSRGGSHTLHSEAEPQQQLEMICPNKDQFSCGLDKTCAHDTNSQQFKITSCPRSMQEVSSKDVCAKLPSNCVNSSPSSCSTSNSNVNITAHQTEHSLEVQTCPASLLMACESTCGSDKTGVSLTEIRTSSSNDLTSLTDITPMSTSCTAHTESPESLTSESITDLSGSSCSSVSQNESGSQAKHKTVDAESEHESQFSSKESKSELLCEDIVTAAKVECKPQILPDSKHSVYAMSSFWSEMETLTINDILGLRGQSKDAVPNYLPPLEEIQEAELFAVIETGCLTQPEESEHVCYDSVQKLSQTVDYFPDSMVWKSGTLPMILGTDIYRENKMLTGVSKDSEPVLSDCVPESHRTISKNTSVQNLHGLLSESFTTARKSQSFQTFAKEESKKDDTCSKGGLPKQATDSDSSPSSSKHSYKISITDIFQYLFGGMQSNPVQTATDNMTTFYAGGDSVPETYDHFFSEFDTESFFCPLMTGKDQATDEQVPIFSFSRSQTRNMQFPEVYDCLFSSASSSSDDSSESGEEDDCGPVRVVSSLSRKASTSQLSIDVYDHFYTDRDLKQNFFWNTALSLRNLKLSGLAVQNQTPSNALSCLPVRQSGGCLQRTHHPMRSLGNQDLMISRPQAQQPFSGEESQTAVANPRLDSPFMVLPQSDMCLVCIAFASWVLKTANPQVGDSWKAVLLANISALSAIRYLRKYVKARATDSETGLRHTDPPEP